MHIYHLTPTPQIQVARIDRPITALEFLREYVQPNVPVILGPGSGLLDHWPGMYIDWMDGWMD